MAKLTKAQEAEYAALCAAMMDNRELRGDESIVGRAKVRLREKPVSAPVLLARYELEADWPCRGEAPGADRLLRFERLSLAARLRMAAYADGGDRPADTMAVALAVPLKVNLDGFPVISARAVEKAVAVMAQRLRDPDGGLTAQQRSAVLRGLHLSGVRIQGDVMLVNLDIPFSIRLRCCVIEGSVIVDHSSLRTLDLSGSATNGVFATFLKVGGNVRMRRTSSLGPVDFGGAHINGVLDLTDAVICPFAAPPDTSAFAGDRGALNLSLANIENEFRANRLRCYGGVTMKGAIIHRSMFMERASLYAPIATVEKMACQRIYRDEAPTPPDLETLMAVMRSDDDVAGLLHGDLDGPLADAMRRAETHGTPWFAADPYRQTLLYRLLAESTRARNSALRADGAKIHGSIFARGLTASGRFRAKYAKIDGGLHLGGAKLRSHAESDAALNSLRAAPVSLTKGFLDLVDSSRRAADRHEKGEGDHYALDIRDTTVGGDLNLDPFAFGPSGSPLRTACIWGTIQADYLRLGGGLCLKRAEFLPDFLAVPPQALQFAVASLSVRHAVIGGDLHLENARGVRSVDGTHLNLGGNLTLTPDKPDRRPDRKQVVGRCEIAGAVTLHGATIGGDTTLLFRPDGDVSLRLRYAVFKGCLNIFPALRSTKPDQVPTLLDGAEPEGGAGAGEDAGGESLELPWSDYDAAIRAARKVRHETEERAQRRRRALNPDAPSPEPRKRVAYIDLRSARAAAFRHAPGAWPLQNGLNIRGFVYDSIRRLGPLGPFSGVPRALDVVEARRWRLAGIGLLTAAIVGPVIAILADVAALFFWPDRALPAPLGAVSMVGAVNFSLFVGLILAGAGSYILSNVARPTVGEALPMAVNWLMLQERRRNPFRFGRDYTETDPFVQAARVLRETGRSSSADAVEYHRMVQFQMTLSRRHQLPVKLLLVAVDRLCGYGFKVTQTVFSVCLLVLLCAMTFELANSLGLMHLVSDAVPVHGTVDFQSLAYALDLIAPFYGGGEASAWAVSGPGEGLGARFLWAFSLASTLFRIAGLLLTTIIVMAIGARIEAFLARRRD